MDNENDRVEPKCSNSYVLHTTKSAKLPTDFTLFEAKNSSKNSNYGIVVKWKCFGSSANIKGANKKMPRFMLEVHAHTLCMNYPVIRRTVFSRKICPRVAS